MRWINEFEFDKGKFLFGFYLSIKFRLKKQ